jgi:hypothetical protein
LEAIGVQLHDMKEPGMNGRRSLLDIENSEGAERKGLRNEEIIKAMVDLNCFDDLFENCAEQTLAAHRKAGRVRMGLKLQERIKSRNM